MSVYLVYRLTRQLAVADESPRRVVYRARLDGAARRRGDRGGQSLLHTHVGHFVIRGSFRAADAGGTLGPGGALG